MKLFYLLAIIIGAALASLLGTSLVVSHASGAELYDWSPPADHHAAVCRIKAGDHEGSGCYVRHGHFAFVLTAAHVARHTATATATFPSGATVTGKTYCDRNYNPSRSQSAYDLCAILIDELDITPVEIASGGEMSRIEICGSDMVDLGEVRHYLADITDVGSQIFTTNGRVLNGDSGGPWLSDGKLVGVSSTGSQPIARSNRGRQIFNMSVSTNTQSVQDFVKRMHDGHCYVQS